MVALSKFFDIAQMQPYHHAVVVGKKASLTIDLNQQTWKLFSEAVNKECSPSVIAYAEQRYHFKVKKENTDPLLVKHIRIIQASMADAIRSDHFQNKLTRSELEQQMSQSYQLIPERPIHRILGGVHGSCFRELILPDRVFMDHKRLHLYSGVEKLRGDAYLERLSKAIISHPLEKGMIIPAPDGAGGRDYYEIAHLGGEDGMELCALAPLASDSKLKPIIVFQPTQLSLDKQGISTIINDIEPDLGNTGYAASHAIIKETMEDQRFQTGDMILTAFSLGGNHAARFLKDYPERFARFVIFNAPAPPSAIAKQFKKIVNKESWVKPMKLRIYWSVLVKDGKEYEDVTPKFGGTHIGHGVKNSAVSVKVIKLKYRTNDVGLKNRHVKRILDGNPAKTHRISKKIYTGKKADKLLNHTAHRGTTGWFETLRTWGASYFIHPILHCVWTAMRGILNLVLAILFGENKNPSSVSSSHHS